MPDIKSILFILFWAVLFNVIAYRWGFFKRPSTQPSFLPGKIVLGGFAIYFFTTFILVTSEMVLYKWFKKGKIQIPLYLSTYELGWFQLEMILTLFIFFLIYLKCINPEYFKLIWGEGKLFSKKNVKAFLVGVIAVCIAYPLVIFLTAIMEYLIEHFWGKNSIEQAAVEQLKGLMPYKTLFTLTALTIVFIVPFIEELLFRGFLQSYLRRYLGWLGSLIATAAIFAFFHFSSSQSIKNIEVIIALFVLSLYIGWVYEKERTLWAPIGLHMTFNAINVIAVIIK